MFTRFENCDLNGQLILVRPLFPTDKHIFVDSFDPKLFEYWPVHFDSYNSFIEDSMERKSIQVGFPLVFIEKKSGNAIGSSSFLNVNFKNKCLEIGATFFVKSYQKKGYNVESKLLILKYLFEIEEFNRVELKTDMLNVSSNLAMQKLGFIKEGVFRKHIIMPNGRLRNSVYYSILLEEWNSTKNIIENRLNEKFSKYHF